MSAPPPPARESAPGRVFLWAVAVTVVALGVTYVTAGTTALGVVAVLAVLEISFSFDNALVNAAYLRRLSPFWQRLFLTVGVLVAVFGMRLLFPVGVVSITTGKGPLTVLRLATADQTMYQEALHKAQPVIAAFGGTFLLLIFLDFLMTRRTVRWIGPLERFAQRLENHRRIPPLLALAALVLTDMVYNPPDGENVILGGTIGVVCYLIVGGLGNAVDNHIAEAEADGDAAVTGASPGAGPDRRPGLRAAGKAAVALVCYLELIDASFSFDGVIGSFAVTNDITYIAVGLGIGAVFVRSLTVYFVRQGTLDDFAHLEHGAHYAIGALAVMLLLTEGIRIPQIVTGLVGVLFILAALITSVLARHGKWPGAAAEETEPSADEKAPVPAAARQDAVDAAPVRALAAAIHPRLVVRYIMGADAAGDVARRFRSGTGDLPLVIYDLPPAAVNGVAGGPAPTADLPAPHR